jgi:hypothetical protein
MGVVICPSFHAIRTSERATRRRRLNPILSFDKALGCNAHVVFKHTNKPSLAGDLLDERSADTVVS